MLDFEAKVLADSVSPYGNRLTTMSLTYPRFIHSEFMTHRLFSRNAASSRAIPIAKTIKQVASDPVIPRHWGKAQKGMQASEEVALPAEQLVALWLQARDDALKAAEALANCELHKQIVNRILEPWTWITVIASATNWANFFKLRCHPAAEPHMQILANKTYDAYSASTPVAVDLGQWHLPLFGFEGDDVFARQDGDRLAINNPVKLSVARCARVSYLTHEGRRDVEADLRLYEDLKSNGHWSPFEHAAVCVPLGSGKSNYSSDWLQCRKFFANECITQYVRSDDGSNA